MLERLLHGRDGIELMRREHVKARYLTAKLAGQCEINIIFTSVKERYAPDTHRTNGHAKQLYYITIFPTVK